MMLCYELNKDNKCALSHLTMTLTTKANDVVSVLISFFPSTSVIVIPRCIEKSRRPYWSSQLRNVLATSSRYNQFALRHFF